ncbi:MAG: hypothetical protein MRY74_04095 [Neomegalonema sp.]|nr:hypothetical protein [Neomegalonema sp.]
MAERGDSTLADILAASTPPPAILLVYGNEPEKVDAATGALATRLRELDASIERFQRADFSEIAANPSRIFDLFASSGLFGDSESLIVENAAEKHSDLLGDFFEQVSAENSNARLIIASHDLKRKSSALAKARANNFCRVVSAYETAIDNTALENLAAKEGLPHLSADVLARLRDYSAESGPVLTTFLIQKLALATSTGAAATVGELESLLPESGGGNPDELAPLLFNGSGWKLLDALEGHRSKGEADARFVSNLARLCADVRRVQPGYAAGRARPLFWKTDKVVKTAAQRLDRLPDRLESALTEIHKVETAMRQSDPLASELVERLCLRLARYFTASRRN